MRTPIPGLLQPRAGIRLTPSPPISLQEVPQLFSPGGSGVALMAQDGGSVVIQNLTDGHVFYALVIMDRDARAGLGFIAAKVSDYLASLRGTTP